MKRILTCALFLLLPSCQEAEPAVDPPPFLPELAVGWNRIEPGGDTICSNGSKYSFFVNKAAEDRLLIFFQPGGACLAGLPCDPSDPQTFDPTVAVEGEPDTLSGTFWDDDDPAKKDGIFNLGDDRNPFKDYSMVFVPYCSGDLHLGRTVAPNGVLHQGEVNATTVLDWAFEKFDAPSTVFVAGSSAGGIAAPFYSGSVADRYPNARITVLGDSAGGYGIEHARESFTATFERWGLGEVLPDHAGFEDLSEKTFLFDHGYTINGARHPDMTFAQFDTVGDMVQLNFMSFTGVAEPDLATYLGENHARIRAAVPGFRSFTAQDTYHVVLERPELYTEEEGGVLLHEWLSDLEAGVAVKDVGEP